MKNYFKAYMRMFRSGGYYWANNTHGVLTHEAHLEFTMLFGDPEQYREV